MTFREDYYCAKWGEKPSKEENSEEIKENTSNTVTQTLKNNKKQQKINISFQGYVGYKVDLYEEKIVAIRFSLDSKKYRIYFDYTFSPLHNSYSTSKEVNNTPIRNNVIISNLELQEKVKCGYGELRPLSKSKKLTKFIEKVLSKYAN